jgi:uncharacterized protein (DUF2132 family)
VKGKRRKVVFRLFLFSFFLSPFTSFKQMQPNNKLHGKTLEMILNALVAHYGWPELGYRIRINCFLSDPSIKSSLKFLRKTPWARQKVEDLYLESPVE